MSGTRFHGARDGSLSGQVAAKSCRATGIPIRHVLLDLGGILYDDTAWRRWLFHLVAYVGLHTHYTSFFRVWDCEFQQDVWNGQCSFWQALKRFLIAAGLSPAQTQEIEAACRARFRQFEHDVRPFPSVAETLEQILAAGCWVTVISHQPLSTQQISMRLTELGLSGHMSAVRCAGADISCGTEVFRRLVRRCGTAQETAYVGRGATQLSAAHRSQLRTVAFNYEPDARADYYIEQFDQLPEVLNLSTRELLAAG